MISPLLNKVLRTFPPKHIVSAHCDGPCGVYDPASARIAGEAVLSMTKKILTLETPHVDADSQTHISYYNTLSRYIAIKEQEAQKAKDEILILWTDYFKPEHLKQFPDLHETFWHATKLCSSCKTHVSLEEAEKLLDAVKSIHEMFWKTKGRDVAWVVAS